MKFEIFDNGVFQPIEFILWFIYYAVILTVLLGIIVLVETIPLIESRILVPTWIHFPLCAYFGYTWKK